MPYPFRWIKFEMPHWDKPKFKEDDVFEYSFYNSFALNKPPLEFMQYTFSVRCRFRIYAENDRILWSSLLEVEFPCEKKKCNVDYLMELTKEAYELYVEEYNIRKVGTILENHPPTEPNWQSNKEALSELLERSS